MQTTSQESNTPIIQGSARFQLLHNEISRHIAGLKDTINCISAALLCNGHVLLEGVPGIAKTTLLKVFAHALNLKFKRIQFTPDLLPADLTGSLWYNQKHHEFEMREGPILGNNIILADEINRAPAKVQSALLEAMGERQVTIGSTTHELEQLFLVFATQNPIEQEGTYALPEAQVDRFMFKLRLTYPNSTEEREIITKHLVPTLVEPILNGTDIISAQQLTQSIYVDPKIIDYIVALVSATREPARVHLHDLQQYIQYGASPRGTIALYKAAQAHAFLRASSFVTPHDVKIMAPHVLAHRLGLTYKAHTDRLDAYIIIQKILNTVPTP